MQINLPIGSRASLVWFPELGLGWHPMPPISYEQGYWDKYIEYDLTAMGKELTEARIKFVRKHWQGDLVDIGIGAGRFVQESGAKGFDVNTSAVKWLKNNDLWVNPYESRVQAVTCWDSLEHIEHPEKLINRVNDWVFVSIPIFKDGDSVVKSKHYRPGEHIWYFTERGLINWMKTLGFVLKDQTDIETKLGREDIMSYAFHREN